MEQLNLYRLSAAEMCSLQLNDELAQLREQLRRLEQENDDLESCVRRSQATEEDLKHKFERAEEDAVFALQEIESLKEAAIQSASQIHELTAKLEAYENVVERLLSVVWIPPDIEHDIEPRSEETYGISAGNDQDNDAARSVYGDTITVSPMTLASSTVAVVDSSQEWIDKVEKLRAELKTKTEQLQTTEDNYDEFIAASYEVEKALVSENEDLKRLVDKLQTENASLQTHAKIKQTTA